MGDELGTFTRYPKRKNENPSVIDYTLCGEALLPRMFSFFVLSYTELSDHYCISTHIKVNRVLEREGKTSGNESIKVNQNPHKLKFDKNRVQIFQSNVEYSERLAPLQALVNRPELDKPDLDICISKLNDLIVDSAMKNCPMRARCNNNNKRKKTSRHEWIPRLL